MVNGRCLGVVLWVISLSAVHAQETVFEAKTRQPIDAVYQKVYDSLEKHRFFVVFEADIGANIARFEERWGDNYNRSGLEGLRSLVVCNGWYANQVSNFDPKMLALCPLRVNLIHKDGVTSVLFARPTVIGAGSPAEPVLREVEDSIVAAIGEALSASP